MGGCRAQLMRAVQQSEDVKEKIEDLIPCLNRFEQNSNPVSADGDQGEKKRCSELSGYAHRWLIPPTLLTVFQSVGRDQEAIQGTAGKGRCDPVYR